MLAREMKSCLDVTIVVGITTIARDLINRNAISRPTRIAPALLGLRQALKISIYDYLSKFNQTNIELFLNCYDAIIFIAVSQ